MQLSGEEVMADYNGTNGNDAWTVVTPGTFSLDGLGGTDSLHFGTSLRSAYRITRGTGGAVHVDSVSGASGALHATLYNMEFLYFASGTDKLDLTTYFSPAPGSGGQSITGTSGDDSLAGGTTNDTISGLAGNDTLDGGGGADSLAGGVGDDLYIVNNAGVNVAESADEGTDTVDTSLASFSLAAVANVENLTYTGTAGFTGTGNDVDNSLSGGSGNDFLSGAGGNDRIVSNGGNDTLAGGAGEDTAVLTDIPDHYSFRRLDAAGTQVRATDGAQVLRLAAVENVVFADGSASLMTDLLANTPSDFDDVYVGNAVQHGFDGGLGNDSITAGSGNDSLLGGAGNDTLSDGAGNSTLAGGTGNDSYFLADPDTVVIENSGEGFDTVQTTLADLVLADNVESLLYAGTGDFVGTGNPDPNTLQGNDGADTLDGGAGLDTLKGGKGNDTYVVDLVKSGAVAVLEDGVVENGNEGTDTLKLRTTGDLGLVVATTLTLGANLENLDAAGTGSNKLNLTGNAGNNQLSGNDGDNVLDGGVGNDTLSGGGGNDTYLLGNLADLVVEGVGGGGDTVKVSAAVVGGSYALTDNVENGVLLNAVAFSLGGNDLDNLLTGNGAANVLDGGAGNDTLAGGGGNDTYVVDSGGDVIVELAGGGTDTVLSGVSYALSGAPNLENLTLTGSADIDGTGNAGANVLAGNAGANVLDGGAGNDTLSGGDGNDTLKGGTGNDTYFVDAGDIIDETSVLGTEIDTVVSSVDFTLGGNLENLTLGGSADLSGTGNERRNLILGNDGADTLDGGAGLDTLK
ncbi:MAG TPA: hypothetical protein PKD29_01555, partial [Rhodocyclaceae bacterium]|nr:hypothetical protein [Rhodocyclaceae bacterium]